VLLAGALLGLQAKFLNVPSERQQISYPTQQNKANFAFGSILNFTFHSKRGIFRRFGERLDLTYSQFFIVISGTASGKINAKVA
jgi:hypothetical protein